MKADNTILEARIHSLGTEVFKEIRASSFSLLDPQFYTEKALQWAMKDDGFKTSLFRFVDVLPMLPTSESVMRHIQEYFTPVAHAIPRPLRRGLRIPPQSVIAKVVTQAIRIQVRMIAERFIVGETPEEALTALRNLRKKGAAFTVDLLGEAALSTRESDDYLTRYLELLDCLNAEVPKWKESAPLVTGHKSEATAVNISVKLSALFSQTKPLAHEYSVDNLSERFAAILKKAKKFGAFVYVDMEDCSLTSITLDAFKKTLDLPEFKNYDRVGIVLQAYLRRTLEDVNTLLAWLKKRSVPIAVRLVKGAYWDTEDMVAKQQHWPIPVWTVKASSDANYEQLSRTLLDNSELILPAFASHNVRSLAHAIAYAEQVGVAPTDFELQTLFGMGEPIGQAFIKRGYLVREYSPIGKLIPGMAYLVRRLLENTSNEGFLRLSMHEGRNSDELLKTPTLSPLDTGIEHLDQDIRKEFFNIPLSDVTLPEVRVDFRDFLEEEKNSNLPYSITPVLNGKPITQGHQFETTSPENTQIKCAKVLCVSPEQAEKTLDELYDFFPTWAETPVEKRAQILFLTAEILQKRRKSLIATITLEAGKPFAEADADIAEAIDFLNYYAHEARRFFTQRRMGTLPGEMNYYAYEPRGVSAIISPWNFPLAIPCGMLSAALVTGNCALLKPAEQTSAIAWHLIDALFEAGIPEKALAFAPGIGEEIGPVIVEHRKVSTIAFTGSKQVGLEIIRRAAESSARSIHIKRVIAEMGGKNAIIIDDDADLDEAVKGVVYSAFGFAGQKCSACSRVIVLEECYERFTTRLADAVNSLVVGPASSPQTFVGSVIDDAAYQRIKNCIEEAKKTAKLLAETPLPKDLPKGNYIAPVVFTDIPPGHFLENTEIFGPVLGVFRVKTFEDALALALSTEYGLTGGIFSRSPSRIQTAVEHYNVGNLYINRSCTGALVMRQPFGGARMSGVGSKAGGPDYLQQFLIPRSISENTIRRGFAPSDK